MSAEAILTYVTGLSHMRRLEFQTVIQCAPVLKGIKTANMITVAKGSLQKLQPVLRAAGLVCVQLYAGEKTEVLLLYRYHLLCAHLMDQKVQNFLKKCGYDHFDLASIMMELRRRYVSYSINESSFPHELGVILEYPVEDVEGFMKYRGEQYLLSGYWKVYHNPVQARKRFFEYDRARETAMRQVMEGYSLTEVACIERSL